MQISSIYAENLKGQQKFNSFILCQTRDSLLAQKFPYIVTSLNGKIRTNIENEEPNADYEYNYCFDCINYQINGNRTVLAQGNWIKMLLNQKENNLLNNYQSINYQPLSIKNNLKFYYYHLKNQTFVEINPQYLIKYDCLIFEKVKSLQNEIQFKQLNLIQMKSFLKFAKQKNELFTKSIFTFRCEYAIMSDLHFMGSFVTGLKRISSYLKKSNSSEYIHFIDQNIIRILIKLYPKPSI